jgi:2-aminoadipate transaminase
MSPDLRSLCADAVLDGPPLSTPDPPAPIRYNFDAGYPAPEALPREPLGALATTVLTDPAALGYVSMRYDAAGEPIYHEEDFNGRAEMALGNTELRTELAAWIGRRQGIEGLDAANFILTSGASQAIALAAAAFINPGEGALVEALTFAWGFRSLKMRGADVRMVELDDEGMVIESLERRLQEFRADGIRCKLLYTIPTYQLPTGAVMPLERRKRLLQLAEEWDLIVVEDAIYSDLHFDGPEPPPTLLSLDTSGRVLQAHAFSKIVATGLRLGWMCGRPELIEALGIVREDLGVSQWISRVMCEYMRRGELDSQIERAAAIYRRKRDVMCESLTAACGDLVEFRPPGGGIFMWVHLDPSVDWRAAQQQAALRGVSVREANAFSFLGDTGPVRNFRLGFGHGSENEIRTGIEILGGAISAAASPAAV